jgi:hypothetical protein
MASAQGPFAGISEQLLGKGMTGFIRKRATA